MKITDKTSLSGAVVPFLFSTTQKDCMLIIGHLQQSASNQSVRKSVTLDPQLEITR